jgi:tetratricopeptide (TPR) repeat protein
MTWVSAVLLASLAQTPDPSAEGMKALEARNYEQAVQLFTKAAEADPKDFAALFHLALAYSLAGKDSEAVPRYKRVLEMKPGLYEAELNLGVLLLRDKQAREAIPYLESAAGKKPKEFRPNYYLAEALAADGRWADAEPRYLAALAADPKSAAAESGLGRTLAKQNRLPEAEPHYRRAAELDAAYRESLLELASLFETAKRPADAIAIYTQFPDNPAARERMGELQLESGKPEDAVANLEAAVAKSPTPANRLALGVTYLRLKQMDKAVAQLALAVEAEPSNLQLRMTYGRALRDSKRYLDAAKQFYRATQLKPDSKEAWNEFAAMLILTENYPQALAALDKAAALGGETAAHSYFRAMIYDKNRMYKEALASYEKFLSMSQNQHPDEEFKARQRIKVIKKELSRR